MDSLSCLLKGLDASEVEKALQLLQQRKAQMTEQTAGQPPTTLSEPVGEVVRAHVKAEESLECGAAVAQTEAAAAPPVDPDDVPFAFGAFGLSSLEDEPGNKPSKTPSRKHKKKTRDSSRDGGETATAGSSQSVAASAAPVPAKETPAVPQGLASFGFFTTAPKPVSGAWPSTRLFSPFVPDKRVVARALDFWSKKSDPVEDDVQIRGDTDVEEKPPLTFEKWVDSRAMRGASELANCPRECPGKLQTSIPEPYKGFNREVVFVGFYAISYDPCQARPPYFGTHNHLQDGNMNARELAQLGRFPIGEQMPRLSTLDYDYDSGDDWDALEGGEDIGASSSSDADSDGDSFASSDLDFVVSDGDGSDSECELQRKIMEAREQRLRRLRGKEKLVPSYSGPFVGVLPHDHPLQRWDRLDCVRSFGCESLLEKLRREMAEREAMVSSRQRDTHAAGGGHANAGLMEAALKNRREMSEEELAAMHQMISMNAKLSSKMIVEAFRSQHMCAGVARAEIERCVKRFYERRHGCLQRRAEPWSASDERLFTKTARVTSGPPNGETKLLAAERGGLTPASQDPSQPPAPTPERPAAAAAEDGNTHDTPAAPPPVGQSLSCPDGPQKSEGVAADGTNDAASCPVIPGSEREPSVGTKRLRDELVSTDEDAQPSARAWKVDPSDPRKTPATDVSH